MFTDVNIGIFARMMKAGGFKNSSDMARNLGLTPQAIANYKKKGVIPPGVMLKFAGRYGISVDWLLTGAGVPQMSEAGVKRSGMLCAIAIVDMADTVHGQTHGLSNDVRFKPEVKPPAIEAATLMNAPPPGLALLAPDELIYIGKLLNILRGKDLYSAPAIKVSIDAFLSAAGQ